MGHAIIAAGLGTVMAALIVSLASIKSTRQGVFVGVVAGVVAAALAALM